MDDKTLSTIQLCLRNSTLQEVLSEKITKGLWEKLENIFMKKSLTNRLRLKLRLYTLRMEECTSISNHIVDFTSILNDLDMLCVKVEDENQTLLLLCSLSTSYKAFRDMMVYSREKITLEDVKSTLQAKLHLDNEMINVEKESQGVSLVVDRGRSWHKTSKEGRTRSKSRHKDLTCNYCKKKHIKANYFKLKNKQKTDKSASSEKTNVINCDDTYDTLCAVDSCVNDENSWIMDTGASQHMTPNRDWFESYELYNGNVFMGNSNLCKVIGVGTIKIKFYDDKMRRLTGVRHISDLSKNLISLGSLEEKGCKFQSESGVIHVPKGALIIMKGKRVGTLYFLQGSTVTGSTAIVDSGTTSDDVMKLWHMRLGHMSERGMTILSKRDLLCGQCTSRLDFCEHCVFSKQKRLILGINLYGHSLDQENIRLHSFRSLGTLT
jgi:gag-polypeptide of LTR copia-type/GAG-pre-integrase domain